MLITTKKLLINFQQKKITNLDFLNSIFDYIFFQYNLKKVLIFYLKLLTNVVNLNLSDYQ